MTEHVVEERKALYAEENVTKKGLVKSDPSQNK